jgi:hypothetical protein
MEEPGGEALQNSPLVAGTSNETNQELSKMESDDKGENHLSVDSSGSKNDRDDDVTAQKDNESPSKDQEALSEIEDSPDVIVLDSDDDDNYTNPEPPKELLNDMLINADNIGDTVYSKHWLFTTLMNLIKVITNENVNVKIKSQLWWMGILVIQMIHLE